jgi:hypothetical protein
MNTIAWSDVEVKLGGLLLDRKIQLPSKVAYLFYLLQRYSYMLIISDQGTNIYLVTYFVDCEIR